MYKIRQISYTKNNISIQVYKIENRKRIIIRHIGTAHNEKEKADLLSLANSYIQKLTKQITLFDEMQNESDHILYLNQTEFIGVRFNFFYQILEKLIAIIGFDKIQNDLLLDLVIIRIIEPASKLRSIELLEEYFGIKHNRQRYYDAVVDWLSLKATATKSALRFAKKQYDFNFDILFYDVTTLYFEAFEEDELRKNGFSKDNKSQQPQILVALMVTKDGFPIDFEVFPGNTFEGHTIVPVVKKFIQKHKVNHFTIVADAAMISTENIKALQKDNINYIVGARLANLATELIDKIDNLLPRQDGETIRIETDNGYLICSYSKLRYRKDKYEIKKQLAHAQYIIDNPGKNKKLKFTKSKGASIELNQKLINKTKKLLGIKGYYTNLKEQSVSNQTIIERYHELYKIEQAFRISKHDLQTRPIFHYKEEPIQLHLLICFMALVISKHIEIQSEISIQKFVHESKKITDGMFRNKITGNIHTIRANFNPKIIEILSNLKMLT